MAPIGAAALAPYEMVSSNSQHLHHARSVFRVGERLSQPYLIATPLTGNLAMKIPTTPCPIHGLVPFWNGVFPIVAKKEHPVLVWLYTIHVKQADQALVVHYNVSQEEVVQEMDLFCRFRVGDTVELGPFARRRIVGRKWNFQRGTMVYSIEGNRPGRDLGMEQEELYRRIQAAAGSMG